MSEFRYCPHCKSTLVPAVRGGRERMVCTADSCEFVLWGNPDPVVAGIVQHDEKVLLIQNVGWPAHWYGLVTGFLEAGEHPHDAVLREIEEEVGLRGRVADYVGMYPFARRNQLIIAYHVDVDSDAVVPDREEIADFRWISLDVIVPWNAATGLALFDWLKARGIYREPVAFGAHINAGHDG